VFFRRGNAVSTGG